MLREIALAYDPVEDRIRLELRCVEDGADVTHRLALTRRLCLPLRAGLQDLVRRSAQVPDTLALPVRRALEAGHHQAQLQRTSVQGARRDPANDTPGRLVTRASCGTRRSNGQPVLRFECSDGAAPVTVALAERTMHALAASLDDRMKRAAWIERNDPATQTSQTASARQPPEGLH